MQVRKRDGRLEDFDREKLRRSFVACGVEEASVESSTAEVESWATATAGESGVVEATAIWSRVVEALERSNPEAAERYRAHRKQ